MTGVDLLLMLGVAVLACLLWREWSDGFCEPDETEPRVEALPPFDWQSLADEAEEAV
jgi:hypothetical protein